MAQKENAAVAVAENEGGVAVVSAPTRKPTAPQRKPKQLPPYKVLLHNDDVNTFEHVIGAILKLTTIQPQAAILRALEAHESGVALLLVTHRERAELYLEQFATFNVTVTVEADGE